MSSMTDIVFLLLIFFLVTSTLVNPNALKLLLPKSTGQVVRFDEIEPEICDLLADQDDPTFSIYADETVPVKEVVALMNIAKRNHFKVIMATSPE